MVVVSEGPGVTSTAVEGLGGLTTQGLGGIQGGNGNVTASQTLGVQVHTGPAVSSNSGGCLSWCVAITAVMACCGVIG